jgi:arsenate reductase (thioredoxin)
MNRLGPLGALLIGSTFSGSVGCSPGEPGPEQTVVFVCEHGAAKSVVAAALFNARAVERKLPFRARSRGVTPDPTLLPQAVAGLKADRLEPGQDAPIRLDRADVDHAAAVIAFDPLPTDAAGHARVETWDAVPPVSVDYATARDAMVPRIDALLDALARRGEKSPRPGP